MNKDKLLKQCFLCSKINSNIEDIFACCRYNPCVFDYYISQYGADIFFRDKNICLYTLDYKIWKIAEIDISDSYINFNKIIYENFTFSSKKDLLYKIDKNLKLKAFI